MKYTIEICQKLRGFVDIEADNVNDALAIANKRYNNDGTELPDMDDFEPLTFVWVDE